MQTRPPGRHKHKHGHGHQLQHQVDQLRDTWRADHGPAGQGSGPGTAGGRPGGLMGLDQVGRQELDQVGRQELDQVGRPGQRYPKRKTRRAAGFAIG